MSLRSQIPHCRAAIEYARETLRAAKQANQEIVLEIFSLLILLE
jgi:hypothetical protein